MLRRALSWIWPITVATYEGRFGELYVRWQRGLKVLDTANANQSFGALHRVWQRTLDHALDAENPPQTILMLGFGGGSLPHIIRHHLQLKAPITAVELDPVMIKIARDHFGAELYSDLTFIVGDATIQVHAIRERFDLVLVDLFDDLDLARGVDSSAFLHGLRDRCAEGGMVCINTVAHDAVTKKRCEAVLDHAKRIFNEVHELRLEDVNRMFIVQ